MISLGYFTTEFVLSSEPTSHASMVAQGPLITITQRPGSGAAQLPGLRSYCLSWEYTLLKYINADMSGTRGVFNKQSLLVGADLADKTPPAYCGYVP